MAGKTIVGSGTHERTLRWMRNEIQSLKNRIGASVAGDLSSEDFEPALGDPASDGFVLSSTMAGVRSWVANGGVGPDLTAIEALTGEGLAVRTAADTWALREIAVSGNGLNAVTNPKGIAGNPTISLNIGTGADQVAAGNHNHAGVYEPVLAAGVAAQYYRGDKTWATLNQAAVAGLTTVDSPDFVSATFTKVSANNPVYVQVYSATATHYPALFFRKSAGTTPGTPATTASGEYLGEIRFYGVNAAGTPAFALGAIIYSTQVGAAGGTYVPADFRFYTYDTAARLAMTLCSSGGVHVGGTADVEDNALLVDGKFGCNGQPVQDRYDVGPLVNPGAGAYGASSAANFAAFVLQVQKVITALVNDGILELSV